MADAVRALGVQDPLLDEGLTELVQVLDSAAAHAPGLLVAELKIARGLDYYTGTVYETQLAGYERFGSICSGGRYDNLASTGTERYPGVGISTTGVAGPAEQEGQPAGTVWLGVAVGDQVEARQLRLPGDRDRVRQLSVISLMDLLRRKLLA